MDDADQLRQQSLQCSWTSSLELSVGGSDSRTCHTAVSDIRKGRFHLVRVNTAQGEPV